VLRGLNQRGAKGFLKCFLNRYLNSTEHKTSARSQRFAGKNMIPMAINAANACPPASSRFLGK
jgi:hypothetical protein